MRLVCVSIYTGVLSPNLNLLKSFHTQGKPFLNLSSFPVVHGGVYRCVYLLTASHFHLLAFSQNIPTKGVATFTSGNIKH